MFTETAQQADRVPTITQKEKRKEKKKTGWAIQEKFFLKKFDLKQVPLTFLRAHAVEVDHRRYDESAQRAQSV